MIYLYSVSATRKLQESLLYFDEVAYDAERYNVTATKYTCSFIYIQGGSRISHRF